MRGTRILGMLVLVGIALAPLGVLAADYTPVLLGHVEKVLGILKRNLLQCDKGVADLEAYKKKNLADFLKKKQETKEYVARLSEAQREALGKRYAPRVKALIADMFETSGKFGKKCPKQQGKVTEIFQDFNLN
jgi:hypothetical protein